MKTKISIVALLSMVALFVLPLTANADSEPNQAGFEFTPIETQTDDCMDLRDVYEFRRNQNNFERVNTDDFFRISFDLDRPFCDPVTIKAAIYNMPEKGTTLFDGWPQELESNVDVVIQEAGNYTFTFPKLCLAQQFDLIATLQLPRDYNIADYISDLPASLLFGFEAGKTIPGSTPQIINTGLDHGPLFFFAGTSSALQWWGFECVDDTTSSSTPTSNTDPTTSVGGETTSSVPEETTTTPTTDVETTTSVLGTVVERPVDPEVEVAGESVQRLPVTGSQTYVLIALGSVLLIGGAVFVIANRKSKITLN